MKKLNAIHFSAAKELTKGEQKKLKGGVDGQYACTCQCYDMSAVWTVYTSNGVCSSKYEASAMIEHCGGVEEGFCYKGANL